MITANYYLSLLNSTAYAIGVGQIDNTYLKVKNLNGTIENLNNNGETTIELMPGIVMFNYNSYGLCFGTNDAEESINDYTISLIPKISSTTGSISYNVDKNNKLFTCTKRFILNNTRTEDITIKEFGVFGRTGGQSTLFFRKVIEPFTIASGETVNFDLTFTYQLPNEYEPYYTE